MDSIFKCYHNSDKYLYKKLLDVGQRRYFFYLRKLPNKGEHSIFSQRKQILKKEANIVKDARVCYCRIYHKFVNFIILNLFKVGHALKL